MTKFTRPDRTILNETIPCFFIGRNTSGFWVARESEGRTGGIFLDQATAIRFAKMVTPGGYALVSVSETLEFDLVPKPD